MKKIIYIIAILIVLVCVIITYIVLNKKDVKYNLNDNIIKYELQTSENFIDIPNTNKYFIDSVAELNKFYSIYSDVLDIDKNYLENNSIFIQVELASSGSITMELSSVTFENNTVNFVVNEDYPEIGTNDMAFWYLVAIIPNDKLSALKFDEWKRPSEVFFMENYVFEMNSNDKYEIITDLKSRTTLDDGGSYDSIYYQIDLDAKVVVKIEEDYDANLGGTPVLEKNTLYTKIIDDDIYRETRDLIEEIIDKEDTNEEENYNFFTILTLDYEKEIYNSSTISDINDLLNKFDNLDN